MAKDSKISAQASPMKDRSIITAQEVKKALLPDARPVVKPLASRLVNLQPGTGMLRRGVAYASELIDSLQAQQETVQHTSRINDTIHLLEGLRKGVIKEANVQSVDDQPLCLELRVLLERIKSSIKTLQEMKSDDR